MTYNILDGGFDKSGSRIEHVIDVIKKVNPDVLALQETYDFSKNDNELLKKVSTDTNLPYTALSESSLDEEGSYSVGLLSRHPLNEEYSLLDTSYKGSALSSVIDSPFGALSLCSTHLHATSEDERLKELEVVLKFQSKYEKSIILGDHNALSRTDNYGNLSAVEFTHYDLTHFDVTDLAVENYVDTIEHLKIKNRSTHPTIDVGHPISKSQIRTDYIFVTQSLSPNIKSGEVIKTESSEIASDHYPVVVTLD